MSGCGLRPYVSRNRSPAGIIAIFLWFDASKVNPSFSSNGWTSSFDLTLIGFFCIRDFWPLSCSLVWSWGAVKGLFLCLSSLWCAGTLGFPQFSNDHHLALATEVHFYPKYQRYYGLFNEKGTYWYYEAEVEMITVMIRELGLGLEAIVQNRPSHSAGNALWMSCR